MKAQQQDVALRSLKKKAIKASKKNTNNQNRIQKPEWRDEPWAAQEAAVVKDGGGGVFDSCLGAVGGSQEPYVYVRLLKIPTDADAKIDSAKVEADKDGFVTAAMIGKMKTGLADKTQSVTLSNEQAVFRKENDFELLEDCNLTSKLYPDPGSLLVFLRVYDDDVGDDDCMGQAILEVRDVVDTRSCKESFASIPIYDEEHGELICHCEMSAQWTKNAEGGTITIKIFRLYDFREDIDADEGANACKYLLYFVLYVLIGASLFKTFEADDWGCNNYFDAIWFMVITITSVGYGDCFPETSGTKLLNFVMIIANILCIGWMFSIGVQQMIVMQEKLQKKVKSQIQNTVWKKGDGENKSEEPEKANDFQTTSIMCVTLIVLTCLIYGLNGDETCMVMSYGKDVTLGPSAGSCGTDPPSCGSIINTKPGGTCPLLPDGTAGDCCMGRTNDAGFMNFWDVLQFTVVTMATVGYGDVSPKTTWGKSYGMFFAMVGVAAMARLGALVVNKVMEAAHREKMDKMLGQTLTSLDELDVFDSDGDGRIDKFEFASKMLVMTHECTQDTIDRIMGRFNQIDKDGDGDIDGDDFLKMMKAKVGAPAGDSKIAVDSKLQSA